MRSFGFVVLFIICLLLLAHYWWAFLIGAAIAVPVGIHYKNRQVEKGGPK